MRTHRNITARHRTKTTGPKPVTLTVIDSGTGAAIEVGNTTTGITKHGTILLDREAALALALALQYAVATRDELAH